MYRVLYQCRACNSSALKLEWDLGNMPLANAFAAKPDEDAKRYPLRLCRCTSCSFVQLDIAMDAKVLFGHYAYSTPRSASLQRHYRTLAGWIVDRQSAVRKNKDNVIFEMGSNNGDCLEVLRKECSAKSVLGIEPAANIAEEARLRNVPTVSTFFGPDTCSEITRMHGRCDVFVARHCLAHVDDLRGILLAAYETLQVDGLLVIENAYLLDTLRGTQFDQIYHEHMSYFAVEPMRRLLDSCGFVLEDARRAPVHGGSICLFARKGTSRGGSYCVESIDELVLGEETVGKELYDFTVRSHACIAALDSMVIDLGRHELAAYGASAKGTMLLNHLGLDARRVVRWAVDTTNWKWDRYIPGTAIQVISPQFKPHPSTYLLTAWNYQAEIIAEFKKLSTARFLIPIPFPRVA